jgi:hypothetical protein
MTCQYYSRCRFKANDDVCNNLFGTCRINREYKIREKQKKEADEEMNRIHLEYDSHLADIINKR